MAGPVNEAGPSALHPGQKSWGRPFPTLAGGAASAEDPGQLQGNYEGEGAVLSAGPAGGHDVPGEVRREAAAALLQRRPACGQGTSRIGFSPS